jgi:hypothetical protein
MGVLRRILKTQFIVYIMNLTEYRENPREQERIRNLMEIIPKGRFSVLEIGARYGYMSKLLATFFETVTALDLEKPDIFHEYVINVKGDVTCLEFQDNSYDTVICAEVLEHIPSGLLQKACDEISRVAKKNVLIGVPYNQDIRIGRTTCLKCGGKNPPWGHVNIFNEDTLKKLFDRLSPVQTEFVGRASSRTNFLSALLMDWGGNPWGTYDQEETCLYCGEKLIPPADQNFFEKLCTKTAFYFDTVQKPFISVKPNWIHILFRKET